MPESEPQARVCIAHVSDLHFGRIAHPQIVAALLEEINGCNVDVVAVSGDLTQRARHHEYRKAAAMLGRMEAPTLVVPGNHDVYPWWLPFRRIFRPLARYRRFISDELAPVFERPGLAMLGINSAYGHTVKGGRIDAAARASIRSFFSTRPRTDFKVLVVHHHLTRLQALGPHDVARNARRVLDLSSATAVDLILCGHLHVSHIEPVAIVPENHRVVIASAGTATSSRGRASNVRTNFYNRITVYSDAFEIEERQFEAESMRFKLHRSMRFLRVSTAKPSVKP